MPSGTQNAMQRYVQLYEAIRHYEMVRHARYVIKRYSTKRNCTVQYGTVGTDKCGYSLARSDMMGWVPCDNVREYEAIGCDTI